MKVRRSKSGNAANLFIILAIVIVVGISLIALIKNVSVLSNPVPVLEEGKDYDLNHSGRNVYTIVDENGNTIELERVSTEVFKDKRGNRYKFVSGSPFKYIGKDKN